jgi:hypothetical protein
MSPGALVPPLMMKRMASSSDQSVGTTFETGTISM